MKRSCHIGCLSFLSVPLKVGQFLSMAGCVSKLSTCGEKNEKQLAFLMSIGQILIVLLRMQLFGVSSFPWVQHRPPLAVDSRLLERDP